MANRTPGQKRTKAQRLDDRRQIAELRLQRLTQPEIAERVGVSPATVKRELRHIEREWQEAAQSDIADYKAEDLARLERMERDLWAQWEASKQEQTKRVVEEKNGGRQVRLETTSTTGDPRLMAQLIQIAERRARILGYDAPAKVAPTSPDGEHPAQGVVVLPPTAEGAEEWAKANAPESPTGP